MYGRKSSVFLGGLLYAVSMLYFFAVRLRRVLYALGIFRSKRLPIKVISVGNITLGGTGKTPAVINIADIFIKNGKVPVVLSRGYGRRDESEIMIVSDGAAVLSDVRITGDEPSLIGARLRGAPVVVGKDRYKAGMFAVQKFKPDAAVLDDGFQHIRLKRDIDIALVDAGDPFGNRRLFPAGILREPLYALKRAHAVIITRSDVVNDIEPLKKDIRNNTQARIFSSYHSPLDLIEASSGETMQLTALRGMALLAFSGIARPATFLKLLRTLGADVKASVAFTDHHLYERSDLAALFQRAADVKANMIITTEKDAVRLHKLKPQGIWALRIELKVIEAKEWEEFLLQGA